MSRWTQYDEDEYRLPEGFKRTGYDADTHQYYFKDASGQMYEGAEGAEYSEMTPIAANADEEDYPEPTTQSIPYQPMLPFFFTRGRIYASCLEVCLKTLHRLCWNNPRCCCPRHMLGCVCSIQLFNGRHSETQSRDRLQCVVTWPKTLCPIRVLNIQNTHFI